LMGVAPVSRVRDSICIFHSGYFGYRGAFRTVLNV